jgi:rhodanese-related sulfurtransferase
VVRQVDTDALRELLAAGAQLVEVLPAAEYADEHLPGAIHLPLTELTREAALGRLDPSRPVVAYCFDYQ